MMRSDRMVLSQESVQSTAAIVSDNSLLTAHAVLMDYEADSRPALGCDNCLG